MSLKYFQNAYQFIQLVYVLILETPWYCSDKTQQNYNFHTEFYHANLPATAERQLGSTKKKL